MFQSSVYHSLFTIQNWYINAKSFLTSFDRILIAILEEFLSLLILRIGKEQVTTEFFQNIDKNASRTNNQLHHLYSLLNRTIQKYCGFQMNSLPIICLRNRFRTIPNWIHRSLNHLGSVQNRLQNLQRFPAPQTNYL